MIKMPSSPFKLFRAVASHATAKKAGAASPFSITIRFRGGLNARQEKAFTSAAKRWTKVIVGDLPPVTIHGEVVDDVLIEAEGTAIDGPGNILGQAGPTVLRPSNAGKAKFLPAMGIMSFDTADLAKMQKDEEPYYFQRPVKGARPAGRLPAGTQVLLRSRQGRTCWVVDGRGLRVAVACESLDKL
jgi:hypothetical protein